MLLQNCTIAIIQAGSKQHGDPGLTSEILTSKCSARVLIGTITVAAPESAKPVAAVVAVRAPAKPSTGVPITISLAPRMFELAVVFRMLDR